MQNEDESRLEGSQRLNEERPSPIFSQWFVKFIEFTRASKDDPVLLLLDGHSSHTKNLKVVDMARDNGVHILCFPPHCSHRLQPLDVYFMKPLSQYYSEQVFDFQRNGEKVTMKDIFSLLEKAFMRVAKIETAVNGFKKTGIYPLNPTIFSKKDFAASCREETINSHSEPNDGSSNSKSIENVEIIKNIMKPTKDENETYNGQRVNNEKPLESSSRIVYNENLIQEEQVMVPKAIMDSLGPMIEFYKSYLEISRNQQKGADQNETRALQVVTNHYAKEAFATQNSDADLLGDLVNNIYKKKVDNVAPKRKRTKGVSTVITSDKYKEDLASLKMKQVKKEPKVKKSKLDVSVENKVANLELKKKVSTKKK
uniref:DDE-1 domain-containing protein n=1 Tax=Trichogramma kaykai TaxID=54128 RepID=A0ABD2WW56_9HYME